jgi:pyruvate ferredoxin oxidoreductase delta subunit
MKWDISRINEWTFEDFPLGCANPASGNSDEYATGGWRSNRPERDEAKCNQCLLCWILCPDSAIEVKDEKVVGFKLKHCKGCGVCANECPVDAITMVPEGCDLPEVK